MEEGAGERKGEGEEETMGKWSTLKKPVPQSHKQRR